MRRPSVRPAVGVPAVAACASANAPRSWKSVGARIPRRVPSTRFRCCESRCRFEPRSGCRSESAPTRRGRRSGDERNPIAGAQRRRPRPGAPIAALSRERTRPRRPQRSSRPARNSLVPGGPLTSSQIGPPSGSAVIWNVRKRQHCRSVSRTLAIVIRMSSAGAKRIR